MWRIMTNSWVKVQSALELLGVHIDTELFFVTFRSMTCRLWIFLEAAGRTVADIGALESETAPSLIATLLYGLRYFLGRVFGWDENRCGRKTHFWNA